MDTVNSFKGYGKVNEAEEAEYKRKTRKRIIIFSISLVLLLVLIIGVVAATLAHKNNNQDSGEQVSGVAAAVKSVCSLSLYPTSCFTTLQSSNSTNPQKIFQFSLKLLRDSLKKLSTFPDEFAKRTDNTTLKQALKVCTTTLNDAVDSLDDVVSTGGKLSKMDDVRTWLSTVVTDQETCIDALEEVNATFVDQIKLLMKNSTEFASNSLAIVSKIILPLKNLNIPTHGRRRLLGDEHDFPAWVDRRLLQETNPTPDVTVAADGTGDVTTIAAAVAKIPKKNATRFVIHIKAGKYVENVELDESYWNVMMYGDGKAATIISGSKNSIDGTHTFFTATFAVVGRGFIARDIGFINTAGAIKHQAVALRSGSDESVFYRCSFDSFQDTLYAHSNRQFYRDCDITGTIDFIFGNAAVVFQNCNILPRQPLSNQFVTITAQGKIDPNQNTGISIQRCTMSPLDALTAPTYLGRPWKDYSVTVIMETNIGGFLNPKGWISWIPNVDPPSSIFYAEYQNTGLGSSTASRVTWAGYRPTLTPAEASKYNVESLIQGPSWLPATSVAYDL